MTTRDNSPAGPVTPEALMLLIDDLCEALHGERPVEAYVRD
jgi:hypothetical protein